MGGGEEEPGEVGDIASCRLEAAKILLDTKLLISQ